MLITSIFWRQRCARARARCVVPPGLGPRKQRRAAASTGLGVCGQPGCIVIARPLPPAQRLQGCVRSAAPLPPSLVLLPRQGACVAGYACARLAFFHQICVKPSLPLWRAHGGWAEGGVGTGINSFGGRAQHQGGHQSGSRLQGCGPGSQPIGGRQQRAAGRVRHACVQVGVHQVRIESARERHTWGDTLRAEAMGSSDVHGCCVGRGVELRVQAAQAFEPAGSAAC
jgi:hypothetical protein